MFIVVKVFTFDCEFGYSGIVGVFASVEEANAAIAADREKIEARNRGDYEYIVEER